MNGRIFVHQQPPARGVALDSPDALKARVADAEVPDPTMEQAFIRLIERAEADVERAA
jgi:ABC-2 type transport system ATP-binding protein